MEPLSMRPKSSYPEGCTEPPDISAVKLPKFSGTNLTGACKEAYDQVGTRYRGGLAAVPSIFLLLRDESAGSSILPVHRSSSRDLRGDDCPTVQRNTNTRFL